MSEPVPLSSIDALIERNPLREIAAGGRTFSYREAGAGQPTLVLLHGIGSSSGSWTHVFDRLGARFKLIAWDAPGYGRSTHLTNDAPLARDYADALEAFLDALAIERPILVGHSLGALMAGSFAARHPQRVAALVLASPAGGYGLADAKMRDDKLRARLALMDELGPAGLADKRSGNLLSANASAEALALVKWSMRQLDPRGHAQAAQMLATGRLIEDAPRYPGPLQIIGASADTVTPDAGSRALAAACKNAQFLSIPGAGHASYVEAPQAFCEALVQFIERG